jgi:hypothetical protein
MKTYQTKTDDDHDIISAMICHGDAFTSKIAQAALVADDDDFAKIKAAFPELWKRYEEFIATSDFVQTY